MTPSTPAVLVVDDRGLNAQGHPEGGYPDFVEFRETLGLDAAEADPDAFRTRYAAVLIHGNQRDPYEVSFVADEFSSPGEGGRKPHVRFVGEGDIAEEYDRGFVEVNRRRYGDHVVRFLEHLRQTGEADLRIFAGHDPHQRAPAAAAPLDASGVVTFDGNAETARDGVLPVPLTPQNHVDWAATLVPLIDADPETPLSIPETLPGRPKYSGLRLLAHLRLGAFFLGEASRRPVLLALDSDPATLLRSDPLHAVAFSKGTAVYPAGEPAPAPPAPLSIDEQRSLAERLGAPPPDMGGPHDVANVWGPVGLQAAAAALQNASVPQRADAWTAGRRRLLLDLYFWRLLTLALLRRPTEADEGSSEDALQARWASWVAFLNGAVEHARPDGTRTEPRPFRVAYVDDEASVWIDPLRDLFATGEAAVGLAHFPAEPSAVSLDAAEAFVDETDPDLLLCDLRLQPADEQAHSSPSPDYLASLSGVRLLQRIKAKRPTLPVIVFTASSKAWTLRHVLPLGADGYWVKEHPADAHTPSDSVDRVVDLINQVEGAVVKRRQIDFLWRLRERLVTAADDAEFVAAHLMWPERGEWPREKSRRVRDRMQAAADRVAQAYGSLEIDPGPLREASFALNRPYDVAFLSLYSATSEALAILTGPVRGSMFLLGRGGLPLRYWHKGDPVAPDGMDPALFGQYVVRDRLAFSERGGHVEPLKIALLNADLPENRRIQLVKDLDGARKLRNKLSYVHGTIGNAHSQRAASLEDIRRLAGVVYYLFRLDLRS